MIERQTGDKLHRYLFLNSKYNSLKYNIRSSRKHTIAIDNLLSSIYAADSQPLILKNQK
jgi:hypothetical protein